MKDTILPEKYHKKGIDFFQPLREIYRIPYRLFMFKLNYFTRTRKVLRKVDLSALPMADTLETPSTFSPNQFNEIRSRLNLLGYDVQAGGLSLQVRTISAVCRFQKDTGLKMDGLVGPKTWNRLHMLTYDLV